MNNTLIHRKTEMGVCFEVSVLYLKDIRKLKMYLFCIIIINPFVYGTFYTPFIFVHFYHPVPGYLQTCGGQRAKQPTSADSHLSIMGSK